MEDRTEKLMHENLHKYEIKRNEKKKNKIASRELLRGENH